MFRLLKSQFRNFFWDFLLRFLRSSLYCFQHEMREFKDSVMLEMRQVHQEKNALEQVFILSF